MFDVRLKGQRPADYLQMVFVEQMDNDYVLGEKQRGDGREVLQEKQYSILFLNGQEHRERINISPCSEKELDILFLIY